MENQTDNIVEFREKIVEKFMIPMQNDYKLSKNLEIGCYNAAIMYANEKGIIKQWDNNLFREVYLRICISLFTNLDKDSYVKNNYLQEKILNGEIKAFTAGSLTPQEMFPDIWKNIKETKERKDKMAFEVRQENVIRGIYTCGKCKKDAVTIRTLQTRGSDEATTVFVCCVGCGNQWKD